LQNNEKTGKIKKVEVCGSEEYSVVSTPVRFFFFLVQGECRCGVFSDYFEISELIGYENMWSIILDGGSEVSRSAMKTFTNIFSFYASVTPKSKPFKVIFEKF
jgi:hypothetical protein